jgi:hypothetical protein
MKVKADKSATQSKTIKEFLIIILSLIVSLIVFRHWDSIKDFIVNLFR